MATGRVDGKIALVTGAGQGMGREHARLLAAEGAAVVVTDWDEDAGRDTVDLIEGEGGFAQFLKHDVSSSQHWDAVASESQASFGRVDILVNNAGVLTLASVEETTVDQWDRHMSVNAKGTFLGCQRMLPAMRASNGASIVNVASLYALVGAANAVAYTASKGAVRALTRALAVEYATDRIRVNAVFPGVIRTGMTAPVLDDPSRAPSIIGTTLLGRAAAPTEVSAAVLFLASDESSFMTGSEVVVDGGFSTV